MKRERRNRIVRLLADDSGGILVLEVELRPAGVEGEMKASRPVCLVTISRYAHVYGNTRDLRSTPDWPSPWHLDSDRRRKGGDDVTATWKWHSGGEGQTHRTCRRKGRRRVDDEGRRLRAGVSSSKVNLATHLKLKAPECPSIFRSDPMRRRPRSTPSGQSPLQMRDSRRTTRQDPCKVITSAANHHARGGSPDVDFKRGRVSSLSGSRIPSFTPTLESCMRRAANAIFSLRYMRVRLVRRNVTGMALLSDTCSWMAGKA